MREYAITPTRQEAAYIRYLLSLGGSSLAVIARMVDIQKSTITYVLSGRRHSRRVEKAVAAACGYSDWNTMLRTIRGMQSKHGDTLPAA